jgi:hypothetical protein
MKNLIQAAVVTLLAASAAQAQQAVQWRVEDGGNGHWFGLGAPAANWHAAAADAASKGGHLATLRSTGETAFAASVAGGENVAYIGAVQAPGSAEPFTGWQWITGEPWGYESWHFNMDDAPCGSSAGDGEQQFLWMHNAVGQWDDVNDQDLPGCPLESKRGIVEWSADCNGDGIVDYGQCRNGSLPDYNGNNIPDCCEQGTACVVGNYPVQWKVSEGGNGHWYDQRIWTGPKAIIDISASYVAQIGAHAVTITSPSENEFVYRAVHSRISGATHDGYSILGGYQDPGASDYSEPSGGWRWVTGEPMAYMNWGPGLPDNCCVGESVLQYPNASYWNDAETAGVPAGHQYRVIVEWSADCNNDGTVDYGQILTGQLADLDTDGIPDVCQQPTCRDADLYRNNRIDGADLGILLSEWGPVTPSTNSDINKDGSVNGADLGILLSFWGACPN